MAPDERTPREAEPHAPAIPQELPLLPVKDLVLFPSMVIPLTVTDAHAIQLIDDALSAGKLFGYVVTREAGAEGAEPKPYDLYEHGTIAEILKMLKFPDGSVRILVQGRERFHVRSILQRTPYLRAEITPKPDVVETDPETGALVKNLAGRFVEMIKLVPYLPDELQVVVMNLTDPAKLGFLIAANMNISTQEKQKLLEIDSARDRLQRLSLLLNKEMQLLELGTKIQTQVQDEIGKLQKEHFLREQMKAIQKELGDEDDRGNEVRELKEKLGKADLPPEARKVAEAEIDRLARIAPGSAEYTVARTYIDWLIILPWSRATRDTLDLRRARRILDADHYGLTKVKERILEHLAVLKLKSDLKGSILCFLGPPGVGKTSLGRSIARAMGRNFVRVSLGGVRDEAEIRGHRRTYVGALPGRILQGMKRAESRNPVFILDEIDKLGTDFRGDPSSALLEVLDPEQNESFSDHYLDLPFDLSRVLFITTANAPDTIPGPLLDRMEILEIPGYSEEEKQVIARRHLIPKQLAAHGLAGRRIRLDDPAVARVVSEYTREAGLRNLERELATVLRKIARRVAEGRARTARVRARDVESYLGPPAFDPEHAGRARETGVAVGLAWTRTGGDILFLETIRMPGSKGLMLTGSLGDVMKESAHAALSWIRSHARSLGISEEVFAKSDIHVHVPAGAIPKDGPSAGVAITSALVSLLTDRPLRPLTAMTGEITLRGKVLPIGGVKEKVLAARRAGIRTVLLPARNEKDLEDLPRHVRRDLRFEFIHTIQDVLRLVFEPVSARGTYPARSSGRRRTDAAKSPRHPTFH